MRHPARDGNRAGCPSEMAKFIFATGKPMSYMYVLRSVTCSLFLCAVALPARQASGRSPQKQTSGDSAPSARGKKDACVLLTSVEIEAVQGEPVRATSPSVRPNGEMLVSECIYHTAQLAKSVSLVLATPSSGNPAALTPRKFWQRQFHAVDMKEDKVRAAGKSAEKPEPEEEEQARKPRRIEGLGEEAYWMGTPITGALYVLQGDNFVRISVGGVGEESLRVEKSKVLARAVVKRL
jgi:hypothetical protein